jgi:uncharacterized membrane protein YhaH (DUF805 family)
MFEFLSFSGRMDRASFFFINVFILLIALIVDKIQFDGLVDTVFLMTVAFGICWLYFASLIKRMRDAGINLWWVLLVFVPLANWILFLTALLKDTNYPRYKQENYKDVN